jgi:hypothetical protein
MKSLLVGFLCLMSVVAQATSTATVKEILTQNIGMASGVVNDGSACDLEVNDSVLPGHLVVYAGIHANVTVMVFPVGNWEINTSSQTLTFFIDSTKENFVKMSFDPISLKIKNFTSISKTDSLPGNICLLN